MIPNSSLIVSPTEPQGKNRKKVWMQKGKNLFNKDDAIIDGYYIDNSGNLISASNSWYQNVFIKVKSNTQYTMSSGHEILRACFYDNNKNYISRVATENTSLTFLTPSNCEYIKLSGDTSSIQILDLQLEQCPNATDYEAYIEPKIYIKNSNNVYEKFIKKEQEIYSTSETKIGTWIDGKPLYRKVVDCGTMPNATSKTISTGLSNVSYKKMEGMITNGTLYYEMNNTRPTDTNTINTIGLYINNNYIIIESKIDRSSYTGHVILEYTKNN